MNQQSSPAKKRRRTCCPGDASPRARTVTTKSLTPRSDRLSPEVQNPLNMHPWMHVDSVARNGRLTNALAAEDLWCYIVCVFVRTSVPLRTAHRYFARLQTHGGSDTFEKKRGRISQRDRRPIVYRSANSTSVRCKRHGHCKPARVRVTTRGFAALPASGTATKAPAPAGGRPRACRCRIRAGLARCDGARSCVPRCEGRHPRCRCRRGDQAGREVIGGQDRARH